MGSAYFVMCLNFLVSTPYKIHIFIFLNFVPQAPTIDDKKERKTNITVFTGCLRAEYQCSGFLFSDGARSEYYYR